MTWQLTGGTVGEGDAFRTAATFAVLVGALSVLAPFLTALAGVLVALTLACWASDRRRRSSGGTGDPRGRAPALLALGVFAAVAYVLPAPVEPLRGLVLGLGVAPLWWVERRRRPTLGAGGTAR